MLDTPPITISDILAVSDTARHPVPHIRGSVRALTVRELLLLAQAHPGIVEVVDPSKPMTAVDLLEIIGRPGIVAAVSMSMGRWQWRVRRMSDMVLLHCFLSALDVTLGERDIDDFFTERRPSGSAPPATPQEGIARTSRLLAMVRDAAEITARTGIDGMHLSPRRLAFLVRTFATLDRTARQSAALAVSAGMGSEKATEILGELY